MKRYLSLFFTMLKIGLFTFGGGYAMIALLQSEFVEKKGWLDREEFLDMVAIAESTPGPIAINAATYIGYKKFGFFGSVLATAAMCLPSLVIIYLISLFFDAFLSVKLVSYAFRGIQACVVYLILSAGFKMIKQMKKKSAFSITVLSLVCVAVVTLSLLSVKFSSIFYILIAALIGIFAYLVGLIRQKGGRNK